MDKLWYMSTQKLWKGLRCDSVCKITRYLVTVSYHQELLNFASWKFTCLSSLKILQITPIGPLGSEVHAPKCEGKSNVVRQVIKTIWLLPDIQLEMEAISPEGRMPGRQRQSQALHTPTVIYTESKSWRKLIPEEKYSYTYWVLTWRREGSDMSREERNQGKRNK